jgi:hypothetical protein
LVVLAARWRPTIVNHVIQDMFGQPGRIVLAGFRECDDLFHDDLGHRVIAVALEQQRVADAVERRPHGLDMSGIDVVLRKWHGCTHGIFAPSVQRFRKALAAVKSCERIKAEMAA